MHVLRCVTRLGSQRGLLLWVGLPALTGYMIGINTFGDVNELNKLSAFNRKYRAEFDNYKQELYYS